MMRVLTLIVLLQAAAGQPCSICKGGEDISLPDKPINIPGYEFLQTCRQLNETIPAALQLGSKECEGVQSIGSLCGCTIPEDACRLCPDGSPVMFPQKQVTVFKSMFPEGFVPTCEIFEAYLHVTPQDDIICASTQSFLGSYCGCPDTLPVVEGETCSLCPGGEGVLQPDKIINLFGFETCADFDEALRVLLPVDAPMCSQIQSIYGLCGCPSGPEEPCTVCKDGSPITIPNRTIPFIESPFGAGFNVTCELYEANVLTHEAGDGLCLDAQGLGSYCGCPVLENHCEFCPGENISSSVYSREIGALEEVRESGLTPTCEFANALLLQVPKNDALQCFGLQQLAHLCGCNDGKPTYMAADTDPKMRAIMYTPKAVGFISSMAAAYVIYDILHSRARRSRVYTRIIALQAAFDCIVAFSWFIGNWAVPVYDEYGDPTGVLGAKGNQQTCTAQGFLTELAMATLLMNVSLGIYYLLVINYGWKESRLQKIHSLLLIIPTIFGVVLAFAGLPYYAWLPMVCQVVAFPLEENLGPVLGLTVLPVAVSMLALSIVMLTIYFGFYHELRHKKRELEFSEKHKKMTEVVFLQSTLYLLAFLTTWPVILAGTLKSGIDGALPYGFGFMLVTVAPLQGLVNALVYFRARTFSRYQAILLIKDARGDKVDRVSIDKIEAEDNNGHDGGSGQPEASEAPSEKPVLDYKFMYDLLDPALIIAFEVEEEDAYRLEYKPRHAFCLFKRQDKSVNEEEE